MIETIERILSGFRPCFRRKAAFRWFVLVVFGFLIRWDTHGVSSLVRAFLLEPTCYPSLLHFFRASSWELDSIVAAWIGCVNEHCAPACIQGFVVLIGDGVPRL